MFNNKKLLMLFAAAAAVAAGVMVFAKPAEADLFSDCPVQAGSTRFFDFATGHCGYVFGDNRNWGTLPGGWNDRADQFGNDGNTHSNCLYQDINCGGVAVLLKRGFAVDWSNIVSSNRWTTASSCVTSC